ncbi:MAG: PEP-utilizing enzyme, partial [Armatimonadota bacterium]
ELARGWLEAGTEAESLCALAAAALRLVMIELAGRLVESGVLRAEQDIFVLQVEEMIRLLASTGKAQKASAAGLLARRKHELWLQGRLAAPGRLRPEGYGPETPSTIGARGIVRGRGVSPGAATGRVCPARTPAEASNMANGDILIVKSPSLAWTPFFGVAGAFACEDDDESWIGSIAADYGIPAVIGCEGITSAFVQGERVTVDGRNGFVELSRGRFSRAEEEILADEDPIAALLRKNR